jgi:hypothetical protein
MRKGFTDAFLARFSQVLGQFSFESIFICVNEFSAIPRWMRVLAQTSLDTCTNYGHRLVDGVHSIENMCTYERVFFVD